MTHFFAPASKTLTRAVGVVRVVVGGAALLQFWITLRKFGLLDDPSIVHAPVIRLPYAAWLPLALTIVGSVAALLFALGKSTTVAGTIATLGTAYPFFYDLNLYSSHQYLLVLYLALLTLGGSGAAVGIDASARGERAVPGWLPLLICFQISAVYFFTATAKLLSPGFMSGAALGRVLHIPGHLKYAPLLVTYAWLTIALELFLAFGLWFRPTRRFCFLSGTLFHLSFLLVLPRSYTWELMVFALVVLSSYLLFANLAESTRTVVWDDQCSFCAKWIDTVRRLDWLRACTFHRSSDQKVLEVNAITRAEADAALQVIVGQRQFGGIDAVREIIAALPLTFWAAVLLSIPVIHDIGTAAYARVASRRSCRFYIPAVVE